MPPPYPLFREALAGRNLHQALRLARELPTIPLTDAARLLQLMATDEMADADLYERAAIRWLQRYCGEAKHITLRDCMAAAAALDALDEQEDALEALLRLTRR